MMIEAPVIYQEHTLYYQNPYEQPAVVITNLRAYIGSNTLDIAEIYSASVDEIPPRRGIGILGLSLMTLGFLSGALLAYYFAGGVFYSIAVAVTLLFVFAGMQVRSLQRPRYAVKISSTSGVYHALTSGNRKYIENIVVAINAAVREHP